MLARHLKMDDQPFERIFDLRKKNAPEKLDEISANRLFSDYMRGIEHVIDAVDQIRKS
jgi:soluble cytochrome b562